MPKNGLVLITKTSFTGQASVSINNCFSATYTHYVVKRNLLGSSADLELRGRLRVGGVDTTGTGYRRQYLRADSTTVSGARTTGLDYWPNFFGYTEATSIGWAEVWVSNPFEAVRTTAWSDQTYQTVGSVRMQTEIFAHDDATSFTSLTVYPATGTITGSISVYGLVKS